MEDTGIDSFADRRSVIDAARVAVRDLHVDLAKCPADQLGVLAGDLAELRAMCGVQLAAVTAAAEEAGVVEASQYASTRAWLADVAWHSRREAGTLAKTATVLRRPDLEMLHDALLTVDVDPVTAVAVAKEYDLVAPDLEPGAKRVVLDGLLEVGAESGPPGVRQLRLELLATCAQQGAFGNYQETCRRQITLGSAREKAPGVFEYELVVDSEGRAVLEAAIGPLAKPVPDPETGAPMSVRSTGDEAKG